MESKIQELLSKAQNEVETYKKEHIWTKKVKLMDQISAMLDTISTESSMMLDKLSGSEKPGAGQQWQQLCKMQNDAAAVRRGLIDYMFKTAA